MNSRDIIRMDILRLLLNTLGRDFVMEYVIRDVKKIEDELFPVGPEPDDVPF